MGRAIVRGVLVAAVALGCSGSIAYAAAPPAGTILALGGPPLSLYGVDPSTGQRTAISDLTNASQGPTINPYRVAAGGAGMSELEWDAVSDASLGDYFSQERAMIADQARAGTISSADATRLGAAHPLEPFSLAFLDPPYGKGLAEKALHSVRAGGWLLPEALIVVEEAAAAGFAAPEGFAEIERRAYDDTELTILRSLATR